MSAPKLPKDVIMMIEKNNMVMAIKTLAAERNIGLDDAKAQIDIYETKLLEKQQKKVASIAKKQGINQVTADETKKINSVIKDSSQSIDALNHSLDNHLKEIGYKKPLLPYWAKRVLIVLVIIVGLFYLIWQLLD